MSPDDPASLERLRHAAGDLALAGQWQALEALLTDLSFLEAKAEAGLVFDLVDDFDLALRHLPPSRPMRRVLGLLGEALRCDLHLIARHPQALFGCLWNLCWW